MSVFTKREGVLDRGWLDGALHGRLQRVAVGIYMDRDVWSWGFKAVLFKGYLCLSAGPLFVEFGG